VREISAHSARHPRPRFTRKPSAGKASVGSCPVRRLPVVGVFRYTAQRFHRAIGEHFGIDCRRVSRIVSNSERQRARGKT